MRIIISDISLTEKAAKLFSGKPLRFNTEFRFDHSACAVKCNGEMCGFSVYGLKIDFQSFHFYFLDMDGETVLKFNHGDVYKAEDLDENRYKFIQEFLKQEIKTQQPRIFRLMHLSN